MSESGLGCYVYCVVRESEAPPIAGLTGVDPAFDVQTLPHRELTAVVSEVRLEEFGAEALKRNLEDLGWLERAARAHDAVLARALTGGAVVPLRLCTIFADQDSVRQMLDRERPVLLDALRRLAGHAEWSVKLLADQQRMEAAVREQGSVPAGAGATQESDAPGRAFFARKKAERTLREQAREVTEAAAEEAHGRLALQAAAATLLPPQDPQLSGRSGEMVLNGAYLVERSRTEGFVALAQELAQRNRAIGIELDLSGPFAPYNFVAAPDGSAASEESL